MPVGVLSPRNVPNSERVKSALGNDDVDLADVPFKAPNPIMQHPNKLQSYKSNGAVRERSWENWSLELGILRADLQFDRVSCFETPRQQIGACG